MEELYVIVGDEPFREGHTQVFEAHPRAKDAKEIVNRLNEYNHRDNFDGRGGRVDDSMLPERFDKEMAKRYRFRLVTVPFVTPSRLSQG